MEVTNSVQTYKVAQTETKGANKTHSKDFDLNKQNGISPEDISFEEYKSMSEEELNELFPYSYASTEKWKYTDEQKIAHNKASSLKGLTTYSEDPLLNKTLFDLQKEDFSNGMVPSETRVSSAIWGVTMVMGLEEPIVFPPEFTEYMERVNKDKFYMRDHPEESQKAMESLKEMMKPKPMTYEYFTSLIKLLHERYDTSLTDEGREFLDSKESFKNLQTVVSVYEERKKENEALLEQMTKSSKPLSLEESKE